MGISLSDLPTKAQQQAIAKILAQNAAKQRHGGAEHRPATAKHGIDTHSAATAKHSTAMTSNATARRSLATISNATALNCTATDGNGDDMHVTALPRQGFAPQGAATALHCISPHSKGKGNKLHAEKVHAALADGTPFTFASKREYDRYCALVLLQRAGQIGNLQVQVKYELIPKQTRTDGKTERAVSYVADFLYEKDGKTVVEDSKGYRNPSSAAYAKFVLKRKLMKYIHNIEILEV